MGKKTWATYLGTAIVFLTACSPLEESTRSGPTQGSQNPTAQSTVDIASLKSSQLVDGRFYEVNGLPHFSYTPPDGWTVHPSVQSGLASLIGPNQSAGMNMMLQFTSTKADSTAKDYAQGFMAQLSEGNIDTTILEEGAFSTQAGGDAYRIKFQSVSTAETAVAEYFTFSNAGYLITAGYYRLASENPEQDANVEAAMQTLRFEN
jgi:hypothetical protein